MHFLGFFHFGLFRSGHPLGGLFLLCFLLGLNNNFLEVLVTDCINGILHLRKSLRQILSVFHNVLLADDLLDWFWFLG